MSLRQNSKCSDRSVEMLLPALLENYDIRTDRPTNQPTDRPTTDGQTGSRYNNKDIQIRAMLQVPGSE